VTDMTTPLLQQPEFTGLLQVSNVPDNQEQWLFQDFNVPLTQRKMTFVRIISARDTSFTEKARHNDTHLKRALSSTTTPNTRVSVSIVLSTVYCTEPVPLSQTEPILPNIVHCTKIWSVYERHKLTSRRPDLQPALVLPSTLNQLPCTSSGFRPVRFRGRSCPAPLPRLGRLASTPAACLLPRHQPRGATKAGRGGRRRRGWKGWRQRQRPEGYEGGGEHGRGHQQRQRQRQQGQGRQQNATRRSDVS
jgi:hypothetical protein